MAEKKKLKKIPYGNAGFVSIRSDGYAYVDKTRFIEVLEQCGSRFQSIVRPRRFGKTLFTETLRAYYDKAEAPNFEKNFKDTFEIQDTVNMPRALAVLTDIVTETNGQH